MRYIVLCGLFSFGYEHTSHAVSWLEIYVWFHFDPTKNRRDGPPDEIKDDGVEYYGYGIWPDKKTLEKASFSLMVTAEMAASHFVSS